MDSQICLKDEIFIDLFWYEQVWNLADPITVPESTGFDVDSARKRADQIATHRYSPWCLRGWHFSEAPVNGYPSQEEAKWWLDYLADPEHKDPKEPDWSHTFSPPASLYLLLHCAADPDQCIKVYRDSVLNPSRVGSYDILRILGWRLAWKHLTLDQREQLYRLTSDADNTTEFLNKPVQRAAVLRAFLVGDTSACEPHIEKALRDVAAGEPTSLLETSMIYFAKRVEDRVKLGKLISIACTPEDALLWITNTGRLGFAQLVSRFSERSKDEAKPVIDVLGQRLSGAGVVPLFAQLATTKHAQPAVAWLGKNTDLILQAQLTAEEIQGVQATVRMMDVKKLREHRDAVCPELAKLIDDIIAESELPEFDPKTAWWAEAAYQGKGKKLPSYAQAAALPPLIIDGARLADSEKETLLKAMQTEDRNLPIFKALRERVSATVLDSFAVQLLQFWLNNGAVAKDRWLMTGAGCIGGDDFVLTLTPMIREWPGQSQHKRATYGLDALRNVGSNHALQQIAGIAAKVKFAGIKKRAGEAMEEIAASLGLSRNELEDRIIPDGGLDETGRRVFSYGPRQFVATLTPEGKVVTRLLDSDGRPTGKPKTSLPAPNKSDDPELAAESKKEYSLLKKSLTAGAKIQKMRFEEAMVTGRRWSGEDFNNYFAPNPMVRSLLSGTVWGVFDGEQRVALGRLDETGELIDANDDPIDITDCILTIVHPAELSDAEKAQWGEVFADFELQEAFPQLGRIVHELPADQGDELELKAVAAAPIDSRRFVGAFKRAGWTRGAVLDNGAYGVFCRYLDGGDITVVVQFDPLSVDYEFMDDETEVNGVYLLAGKFDAEALDYGQLPSSSLKRNASWSYQPWHVLSKPLASEVIAAVRAAGA